MRKERWRGYNYIKRGNGCGKENCFDWLRALGFFLFFKIFIFNEIMLEVVLTKIAKSDC